MIQLRVLLRNSLVMPPAEFGVKLFFLFKIKPTFKDETQSLPKDLINEMKDLINIRAFVVAEEEYWRLYPRCKLGIQVNKTPLSNQH